MGRAGRRREEIAGVAQVELSADDGSKHPVAAVMARRSEVGSAGRLLIAQLACSNELRFVGPAA